MRRKLPGMRNDRPNFQLHPNAGRTCLFRETLGIVAQNFVRANVNEKRRKAGKIGIERRSNWVARVHLTKIIPRANGDVRSMEHGTAVRVLADGVAGGGKIGPRRENGRSCWKR